MATTHTQPTGDVFFDEDMARVRRMAEILAQEAQAQKDKEVDRIKEELAQAQDEIAPLEARLVVLWNLEAQLKDDLAQARKAAGKS